MEIDQKLCYSGQICRLCGLDRGSTFPIFDDNALVRNINFFLPIELSKTGPFPRGICSKCFEDFSIVMSFFVTLNDGQAKLAHFLAERENLIIQMPNWIQGKKSLFPIKYPSVPRKVPKQRGSKTKAPKLQTNIPNPTTDELGPGKRTRRLPKRLAESVQGTDLEKIFKLDDPASTDVVVDNGNGINKVQSSETNPTSVEYEQAYELVSVITQDDVVEEATDDLSSEVLGLKVVDEHAQMEELGQMLNQLENNMPNVDQADEILESTVKDSSLLGTKSKMRHKCDICMKTFKLANRLSQHKISQHGGVFFRCNDESCRKEYKTRDAIELHLKVSTHLAGFQMVGTSKGGKKQKEEFSPEITRKEVRFDCGECDKIFKSDTLLEAHLNEVHFNDEPFLCELCQLDITTRSAYKEHCLAVHGVPGKDFSCGPCSKTFYNSSSLNCHQMSNHSNACKICSLTFESKSLLVRHNSSHHADPVKRPFACNLCDMKFKSNNNLKTHMTSHSGEKRFACGTCGKQFSYKTSLIQHLKWHEGDKPFKCEHCGKGFSQNGNLQEHERIHTGDKPFVCSLCDRRFTTSSQHKLHEKRHRGERPWKCDFCPKTFLHKDTWKAHLRRHQGDRPYSCPDCKKSFTELWALKKHSRLHTGEKPYSCQICRKSFSDCSNLTKHRRTHLKQQQQLEQEQILDQQDEEEVGVVRLTSEEFGQGKSVWNIIDEGVIRVQSLNPTENEFVLQSEEVLPQDASSDTKDDVTTEQIIYISYNADEKTGDGIVHNLDQNLVGDFVGTPSGQTSIDLSQLSEAARFQLSSAVHVSKAAAIESEPATEIQEQLSDGTTGLENVLLCGDLTGVSIDGQEPQVGGGQVVEVDQLEDNGSYVDVKLKEGQIIRLKVPFNIDPVVYAAEYLQQAIGEGEMS